MPFRASVPFVGASGSPVQAGPAGTIGSGQPFGCVNCGSPSASSVRPNPSSCTARWCRRHSSTRFSSFVAPPSAQCRTWWASHRRASQPGKRQWRSRDARGATQGGRNRPGLAPDVEDGPGRIVAHHHLAGVAGQSAGRFRGNADAACLLQRGLPAGWRRFRGNADAARLLQRGLSTGRRRFRGNARRVAPGVALLTVAGSHGRFRGNVCATPALSYPRVRGNVCRCQRLRVHRAFPPGNVSVTPVTRLQVFPPAKRFQSSSGHQRIRALSGRKRLFHVQRLRVDVAS